VPWGVLVLVFAAPFEVHTLSGNAAPSPVPSDLSALLIQRRQSRLAVNLTRDELELLDTVAAKSSATRSNTARALLLSGIRELQAA